MSHDVASFDTVGVLPYLQHPDPITLLLLSIPTPAPAATVLPALFATRYCSYRQAGFASSEALRAGLMNSTISSDRWTTVIFQGQAMRSDYVDAILAVQERCPQYLPF